MLVMSSFALTPLQVLKAIHLLTRQDVYYECCNLNRSYILPEGDIGAMGTVATELETIFDSDSDDDTITISDTDDDSKPKQDCHCWSPTGHS